MRLFNQEFIAFRSPDGTLKYDLECMFERLAEECCHERHPEVDITSVEVIEQRAVVDRVATEENTVGTVVEPDAAW